MARTYPVYRLFVRKPTPLLCRLWGHSIDPDASYYYAVDYRERCVEQVTDTGPREWIRTRLWIVRCRILDVLKPAISFFRRCPDCQHRFNRCDES